MQKEYYEAYDDRYRQIHQQGLQWFSESPSAIVEDTIRSFSISPQSKILEIGCGEGRDACFLLKQGFDLLATDVSQEAIAFCRERFSDFAEHFQVLDCISGECGGKFCFIYAVAVLHMLVADRDRKAFYRFIRAHLTPDGLALICTMGDGSFELQSDIRTAFEIQERIHGQTGKPVQIAGTSCRVVSFDTFHRELKENGFAIVEEGNTSVAPDFPQMMFAVVRVC